MTLCVAVAKLSKALAWLSCALSRERPEFISHSHGAHRNNQEQFGEHVPYFCPDGSFVFDTQCIFITGEHFVARLRPCSCCRAVADVADDRVELTPTEDNESATTSNNFQGILSSERDTS